MLVLREKNLSKLIRCQSKNSVFLCQAFTSAHSSNYVRTYKVVRAEDRRAQVCEASRDDPVSVSRVRM